MGDSEQTVGAPLVRVAHVVGVVAHVDDSVGGGADRAVRVKVGHVVVRVCEEAHTRTRNMGRAGGGSLGRAVIGLARAVDDEAVAAMATAEKEEEKEGGYAQTPISPKMLMRVSPEVYGERNACVADQTAFEAPERTR